MKKTLFSLLSSVICLTSCFTAVACKKAVPAVDDSNKIITVGASTAPHAEILAVAKEILAEKNVTLEIMEFTDYVQPNNVVDSGEIDANYFQHLPYLEDFNAENGTKLVCVATIQVEPMGLYGGKQENLNALGLAGE